MLTNLFMSKEEEKRLGDDFYIENVNQGTLRNAAMICVVLKPYQ